MLEHYSDIHKDCYGSRPTADMTVRFHSMSWDDRLAQIEYMQKSIEQDIEWQRMSQQEAIRITMIAGAMDEATALRWLDEAYEGNY